MGTLDGKTHSLPLGQASSDPLDYLRVDVFLRTMLGSCALGSAFDLGIIDALIAEGSSSREELVKAGSAANGMHLLLDMLRSSNVTVEEYNSIALTDEFRRALAYRDLLEASLDFAKRAGRDMLSHFTDLVADPRAFNGASEVFDLFNYDRCADVTPENTERARQWMRITTRLTKYEAGVCMHHHNFSPYETMLDVGGNSGEFVRRLCEKHANLRATVFDLPVVCEVGRAHLAKTAEASRINFVPGNATREPLPGGNFDLVTFKSVLHDWPDAPARDFLRKATDALRAGGTLLIFERSRLDSSKPLPYSIAPLLLFLQAYRPATTYDAMLTELGLTDIKISEVTLEMPFHLIRAKKPA